MKRIIKTSILGFFVIIGTSIATLGWQTSSQGRSGVTQISTYGGHGTADPRMLRMNELADQLSALSKKARLLHIAEVISDRPTKERIYKERIELMPDSPYEHLPLANLYAREGRYREALEEWKAAESPKMGAWSTELLDARNLTQFGDIALKVGETNTAGELYGKAGGWVFKSGEVDDTDLPAGDLREVRAAAHYESAMMHIPHGELNEDLEDFKIAMPLFTKSEDAHLNYGRLLNRLGQEKQAKAEFIAAERLAPSVSAKKEVHKGRLKLGLIRTESVMIIENGKVTTYVKELPDKGK